MGRPPEEALRLGWAHGALLTTFPGDVTMARLSINYRTPEEVMAEAAPVIRAVIPDANVPISIRSTG